MSVGVPGRIKKELAECAKDRELSGVNAVPVDPSKLDELIGTIKGPPGTPYENGIFEVDITIPAQYPFQPPKMQFKTKVWHPNVSSQTGAICLDILKSEWSPALTIKTALLSIQALLTAAEPTDPQDAQVAKQYMEDRAAFDNTARFWTQTYAMPDGASTSDVAPPAVGAPTSSGANSGSASTEPPASPAVQRLMEMGFPRSRAEQALEQADGDENAAVEVLLS